MNLKEATRLSTNQNESCNDEDQSFSEGFNTSNQISVSGSAPKDANLFAMHMKRLKESLQDQALIEEYNKIPKIFEY